MGTTFFVTDTGTLEVSVNGTQAALDQNQAVRRQGQLRNFRIDFVSRLRIYCGIYDAIHCAMLCYAMLYTLRLKYSW